MGESHAFSFAGGDILCKIGATWFVSYMFAKYIDPSHKNWTHVDTYNTRQNVFSYSTKYHKDWLLEVIKMNNNKLATNKIKVNPQQTKDMAKQLLKARYDIIVK
jgi:hypothetical protein